MRKSHWIAGMAALALGAGVANAADNFSYTWTELNWVNTEFDDFDAEGDGLALRGSLGMTNRVHLFAGLVDQDFDFGIDYQALELGAGFRQPLSGKLDAIGRVAFVKADLDTPFGGADETGFGLEAALRGRLAPQFELEGSLNYIDLGDAGDGTSFGLDGRYFVTETFSFGLGAEFDEDGTTYGLGVRFNF